MTPRRAALKTAARHLDVSGSMSMVDLEPARAAGTPPPPSATAKAMASCSYCRAAVFLVDLEVHERFCFTTMAQARLAVTKPALEERGHGQDGDEDSAKAHSTPRATSPFMPPPRVTLPLDTADCPHCGLPVEIVIMEEHALSCRFQPRVCNLCGERVPLFLCEQHLETAHPAKPSVVETIVIDSGALTLPAEDSSTADNGGGGAGGEGLSTVSELTATVIEALVEEASQAPPPARSATPAPPTDYSARADLVILKHALGLGAMIKEGSPDGCEVVQLTSQGKADRAGICVGEIISAVDGTRLPNPNVLAIITKRVKGFTEEDHEWEIRSIAPDGTASTRIVVF